MHGYRRATLKKEQARSGRLLFSLWGKRGAGSYGRGGCATIHIMSAYKSLFRHGSARALGFALGLSSWFLCGAAVAQDASGALKPVYRCPGPPVLYTDSLSPTEAKEQGCRTIEGAAITIMQAPGRPRPAVPAAAGAAVAPSAAAGSRPSDNRVDPAAQRARDTDARRILGDELKREEERLATLLKDYNGGEPERRGDERNFAKYQERVAEMKAAVARKEADVAALRREISKLPP